jgi:hypothetical protein
VSARVSSLNHGGHYSIPPHGRLKLAAIFGEGVHIQ